MVIDTLMTYISANKLRSFWLGFIILLVTGLIMRPTSSCLVTSATPKAIIDLELAFDQPTAIAIKELWSKSDCSNSLALAITGTDAAVLNILLDFPFIVAYTLFLIVLILLSKSSVVVTGKEWITNAFVLLAIAAALLDVIENIFMLIFLKYFEVVSYLFAIPAIIKFAIIFILVGAIIIRFLKKLVIR